MRYRDTFHDAYAAVSPRTVAAAALCAALQIIRTCV
jgi:hypothetical protein